MGIAPLVVIDTNVVVAAFRSRQGASFALLERVGTGQFEIVVSVPLVLEYADALSRQLSFTGLEESDVNDLLDYLCQSVAASQSSFSGGPIFPIPRTISFSRPPWLADVMAS